MPTFQTPFEDEDKQKEVQPTQQVASGLSGTTPAPASGKPAASAPGAPTSSGSFVNLKKYIDANKGNSGQMAGKVADYAGHQATSAQDAYGKEAASYGQEVKDSTFQADQGLLGKVKSGTFSTADADKIAAGYNAALDANRFSSGYQDRIADEAGALSKADSQIKGTTDYYNRKGLLSDVYGKENPQYGGGLQSLDSLLITRDHDAQSRLEALRNQFAGLGDFMKSTDAGVTKEIDAASAATDKARQAYRDAVGTGMGAIEGSVGQRVQDTNRERNSEFEAQKQIAAWDPNRDPNIDITQFYKRGADVAAGDVVSKEEAARLAALARIAGKAPSIQQSGRATGPAWTFDQEAYDAAVRAAANLANKAPAPTMPKDNSGKVVSKIRSTF